MATSDASARVGAGAAIMLSSICVATTTGLPAARAARTRRFCTSGTSSGGSSTPRSPRATITQSVSARMASRFSTACGFSIFTMSQARPAVISRASATSSGRCTKERPTYSMPCSSAKARSARSFSVSAGIGSATSGTLTPLRSESGPPTTISVSRWSSRTRSTRSRSLPSSSSSVVPMRAAAMISGMRQLHAAHVAGRRVQVEAEGLPGLELHPAAAEAPDAELRPLHVGEDADGAVQLALPARG